jgi:hypothetical protein
MIEENINMLEIINTQALPSLLDRDKKKLPEIFDKFPVFALDNLQDEDGLIALIFVKDEDSLYWSDEHNMYVLNDEKNHALVKPFYFKTDIKFKPQFFKTNDLICPEYNELSYNDFELLDVLKTTHELGDFFDAISEDTTFKDTDAIESFYADDTRFRVDTLFEVINSNDGKYNYYLKKLTFNGGLVMYFDVEGKWGDNYDSHIINGELYAEMIVYIEKKYFSSGFEAVSFEDSILGRFNSDLEEKLASLKKE